jgi:hypothetical protein
MWSLPSAGQATVTVEGGKLSVSLREAGFREVMEVIARQAGMKISLLGVPSEATLTASFEGMPLEDGLRSLLRGRDYAFVYTGTGTARRVGQVFVMPGTTGQPSASVGETVDEPAIVVAKALREATDTQRFTDALQAAIVADRGVVQAETTSEEMAPELNVALQRVLSGQEGTQGLQEHFQQAAHQLQAILERQGQ